MQSRLQNNNITYKYYEIYHYLITLDKSILQKCTFENTKNMFSNICQFQNAEAVLCL